MNFDKTWFNFISDHQCLHNKKQKPRMATGPFLRSLRQELLELKTLNTEYILGDLWLHSKSLSQRPRHRMRHHSLGWYTRSYEKEEMTEHKHESTTFCFLTVESTWPVTSCFKFLQPWLLGHDGLHLPIKSQINHFSFSLLFSEYVITATQKVTVTAGSLFILSAAISLETKTVPGI